MSTGLTIIAGLSLVALLTLLYEMVMQEKNKMKLAPIGVYNTATGKTFDLRDYYVDYKGTLYSINYGTWEIDPKNRRDVLICSDNSVDKSGHVVNSLRDTKGNKVTIRRSNLSFKKLSDKNGYLELRANKLGSRHLNVLVKTNKLKEFKIAN